MPSPSLTKAQCQEAIDAVNQAISEGCKLGGLPSAVRRGQQIVGIKDGGMANRLKVAKEKYGLMPDKSKKLPKAAEPVTEELPSTDDLRTLLLKGPKTVAEMIVATKFTTVGMVLDGLETLARQGVNLHRNGERWQVVKDSAPARGNREPLRYYSRPDNTFLFGAFGDQHIGSKHARFDVMEDLYDRYQKAGVDRVFNTGNYIEGDSRFNQFEKDATGIDAQTRLMAAKYPRREGIETYAVWGDDHEGWYAQREGLNVGRYCENVMHSEGRDDWHDLGFMEANVELININTGKKSVMLVCHPGGGSAYATSYSIQKIVESYEGGEKPEVALYGHFHKMWAGIIRNIWCVQTGTGCDQTTFMRKKRLEAHVGGTLVELEQHPESGAIIAMKPQLIRYFNRDWYSNAGLGNDRWGYDGRPFSQHPRSANGH